MSPSLELGSAPPFALALALGCAGQTPAPGSGILAGSASEPRRSGSESEPASPAPEGCLIHVEIPTRASVKSYPSVLVRAQPPIPYAGAQPAPGIILTITAPDGGREQIDVELVTLAECMYCLPPEGSQGCDHACSWRDFEATPIGVGRHLKVPGPHQVELRLRDYACAIEGAHGVIEVSAD